MLSVKRTFVLGGQSLSHTELSLAVGRLMPELARERSPLLSQGEWSTEPAIVTNGDQRKSHAGTLLHRLHTFQATEYSHPLDCVYALHGIAVDHEEIAMDYSLQLQTLFSRIAKVYIRGYDTLALLFASALVRLGTLDGHHGCLIGTSHQRILHSVITCCVTIIRQQL